MAAVRAPSMQEVLSRVEGYIPVAYLDYTEDDEEELYDRITGTPLNAHLLNILERILLTMDPDDNMEEYQSIMNPSSLFVLLEDAIQQDIDEVKAALDGSGWIAAAARSTAARIIQLMEAVIAKKSSFVAYVSWLKVYYLIVSILEADDRFKVDALMDLAYTSIVSTPVARLILEEEDAIYGYLLQRVLPGYSRNTVDKKWMAGRLVTEMMTSGLGEGREAGKITPGTLNTRFETLVQLVQDSDMKQLVKEYKGSSDDPVDMLMNGVRPFRNLCVLARQCSS